MKQPRMKLGAIAALFTLIAGALAGPALAAPAAVSAESQARSVTGATLAWSINNESGGGAYFGGCNFLSAGKAGSAGSSRIWKQTDGFYQVTNGNVHIEKKTATGFEAPTFATRCQDATGTAVTTSNNGLTGNRVVFSDGAGWLNAADGSAEISWPGSFTVAYYGGMTYWSASNPVLQVQPDGSGRLTATLSGYGADMDDPSKWDSLPEHTVELATFSATEAAEEGFTAHANYLGIAVADNAARPVQVAKSASNDPYWGGFPASFLDYQTLTGQAAYWYASGGAADKKKVAHDAIIDDIVLGDDEVDAVFKDIPLGTIVIPPTDPETPTDPTTPTTPNADDTTTDDSENLTKKVTVKDAVLRWGINAESSSASFYGGCNFLVAGSAGNSGSSSVWTEGDGLYKAASGNVEILKPDAQGTLKRATWANKCATRTGAKVSAGSDATTESIVSITGGTGTLNPNKGTATISWRGSFTVAFYGGMTYWYAKNPVLTVAKDGSATLTATAGGYASSMADTSKWTPLKERTITLANLHDVDVSAAKGFTITPDYLGVAVKSSGGDHATQAAKSTTNAAYWGAFPQSFIDFHLETGQSAYWYTSGGLRDSAKPAAALTVTYEAGDVKDKVKKPADSGDTGPTSTTTTVTRPSTQAPPATPTTKTPPTPATASATQAQNSSQNWPTSAPVALTASAVPTAVRAELVKTSQPAESQAALTGAFIALGIALLAGALALAPVPLRRTRT